MIGSATVLNPGLGLLLALGQVPADVPEGFAAVATLRRAGIRRRNRVLMALSFTAPILIGAALGYFALRAAPRCSPCPCSPSPAGRSPASSLRRWSPRPT